VSSAPVQAQAPPSTAIPSPCAAQAAVTRSIPSPTDAPAADPEPPAATAAAAQGPAAAAAGPGADPGAGAGPPPPPTHPDAADCLTPFTPHGTVSPDPEGQYQKDPENGWLVGNHPDLTPAHRQKLQELLIARKHKCFAYKLADMPGYSGPDGEFAIELTTSDPIRCKPRRYSPGELRVIDEKCGELRDAGFIVRAPPSCQYACCPTLPAKKSPEGLWVDYRFCIDYRPINERTVPDRYGLHLPEDLFHWVGNARVFTKLDLRGAFNQIPIRVEDQCKTAFWWSNALWMFTRMPYGLVSGSAKCQRVMDLLLQDAGLSHFASTFVDDVLLIADSVPEMLDRIALVLDAFHAVGLRLHPDKSIFFVDRVEFLGHAVSASGISPHESKVAAIQALSAPANLAELRSKLQFINYYRGYVPDFATIAAPLNALLKKDAPWVWGAAQNAAFNRLRDVICAPGVVLRRYDAKRPATLYTDWSGVGIAAVLAQSDDSGQEYMVACLSRSLNQHERNYSSYEGEMLAAVWGTRAFRQYLHGVRFTLVTDHQPLKWLMKTPELSGKYARWALILQEFEFTVEHRPGVAHSNADVPSRFPLSASFDPTGACLDPEAVPTVAEASARDHHLSAFSALLAGSPVPAVACPHALALHAATDRQPISSIGCYTPPVRELAAAGIPGLPSPHSVDLSPAAASEIRCVRGCASKWVQAAAGALAAAALPPAQPLALDHSCERDAYGVLPVLQLCTSSVGASFLAAAQREGVVVYDAFGGLCAGLDMVLSNGIRVRRYLYSDIDPAAQRVARQRVEQLHALYAELLPRAAFADAFTALPADVRTIDAGALLKAGAGTCDQWLVVAGWSCEDLSPAGKGKGLAGERSSNFYDAVRIVGTLQQLQLQQPPAYIMENTAMQVSFTHASVREVDFPRICSIIGEPVLIDAARFGSYAHRLRNFWSNLAAPEHVRLVVQQAQRAPGRRVDAVLDAGRSTQPATRAQGPPFYSCNQPGQPLSALPTLVAYPASRAFRNGGPGMLRVAGTDQLVEPSPDERERIMGYATGCTAAEGVSELDRHAITGRAMDRFAVTNLMGVYCALAEALPYVFEQHAAHTSQAVALDLQGSVAERIMQKYGWAPGLPLLSPNATNPLLVPISPPVQHGRQGLGYGSVPGGGDASSTAQHATTLAASFSQMHLQRGHQGCAQHCSYAASTEPSALAQQHTLLVALHAAACQQDAADSTDATADTDMLHFLSTGECGDTWDAKQSDRVRQRASRYLLVDGQLHRRMGDGTTRVVPPVDKRVDIILDTHERTGHFGIKRTKHMLLASYWWRGMETDVAKALATCEVCARIKATFNAERPELQPLPIEGLFYRWGVDLAGPFAKSRDGNLYVMICIEHFSKQIELVPLPAKEARYTAAAFLSAVVGRYGACAEVVTDRGAEFEGPFHQLLTECLIDHRTTSPNHPQADGLAERCVQTVKKALAKHVAQHKQLEDWDVQMHWIALGYRVSGQASTGLSPYQLLYGAQPVIPPAVRPRVEQPLLEFTVAEQAAEYVLQRAELLRKHCAIAFENLRVAQHRDTLRYQQVRSGLYQPPTVKFAVGDFVYVRRRTVVNSLQSEARPGVYRVLEMLPTGVLVLQGRCGGTMKVNVAECAPCHLTNINPVLDPQLQQVEADFPCELCGSPDDEEVMLICDGCFKGYHIYCLQPPLAAVPDVEVWLCPGCKAQGIDEYGVWVSRQQPLPVAVSDAPLFPTAPQREADAVAKGMDGQLVRIVEGVAEPVEARLHYVPRVQRDLHPRSPFVVLLEGQQPMYLSLRKAKKLLVPDEASGHQAAAAEAGGGRRSRPANWDLTSEQGVRAAAVALCGFEPSAEYVKGCVRWVQRHAAAPGAQLGGGDWGDQAIELFLSSVDLYSCTKLMAVGMKSAALMRALYARVGKKLWEVPGGTVTLADQWSPAWYHAAGAKAPIDWVFLAPPEGMIELALALAAQQARKGVAVLAHRRDLCNQSSILMKQLRHFQMAGRLLYLFSSGSAEVWLVVFATPMLRETMVSACSKPAGSWLLM
jgi:hypothetical protein